MQYQRTQITEITEEFLISLKTHSKVYQFTEILNVNELMYFFKKYNLYGMTIDNFNRSICERYGIYDNRVKSIYDLKEIFRKFGNPYFIVTPKIKFIVFDRYDVIEFENHYPRKLSSHTSINPRDVDLFYINGKLIKIFVQTIIRNYSIYFTYYDNSNVDYSCTFQEKNVRTTYIEYYKNNFLVKEINANIKTEYDDYGNAAVSTTVDGSAGSKYLTSYARCTYNNCMEIISGHYKSKISECKSTYIYDDKGDLVKIINDRSSGGSSDLLTTDIEYYYKENKLSEIYAIERRTNNGITSTSEKFLVLLLFSEKNEGKPYDFRT